MTVIHPLLSRHRSRPVPALPLLPGSPDLALSRGRVHEAAGTARRTFALWLAARAQGPVFWIAPQWMQERLNADGMQPWIDPARLVFVSPRRTEDLLWTLEEVLRSGATDLGIADLPDLPGLTQVRRLHLAAESGRQNGTHLPVGLLLTPGRGGAAGVETRWHLSPRHADGAERWHLERLRARTAPVADWRVERPHDSATLQIKTA
jgi:protein ImuA